MRGSENGRVVLPALHATLAPRVEDKGICASATENRSRRTVRFHTATAKAACHRRTFVNSSPVLI